MAVLVLFCVSILIYLTYKYMFYKPENFPPGPPRMPFFGSYLLLLMLNYKHFHKAIETLCNYYKTDVLGFYIADIPTIVAHTTETGKQCLLNPDLDGKPQLKLAQLRSPDMSIRGIFNTEGDNWHEQRKFFLRYLRDFGFGRRYEELELEMRDEISGFIDLLKNGPKYSHENKLMRDGYVYCPNIFHVVMFNGFMKIISNERVPREDQAIFFEAGELAYQFLTKTDDWGLIFSTVPEIGRMFPRLSGYADIKDISIRLYRIIEEIIDKHYKTYDSNFERHFLDLYFNEMKKGDFNEDFVFNYKQLIMSCVDFFIPSFNANSFTMQFLLQHLHIQPEILKRIQCEIDTVVGHGRLPELSDRINLPYLEATLREVMRHETLIPSGLPHRALRDTKFMGYDIPKDCIVYTSLYACHKDPKVWNEPELFNPERFLDANGRFSVKKDFSMPFGAGKRLCAGETFARNTLFLVAAAMLQNFTFEMPDWQPMPEPFETMTGTPRYPPKFWIKFVPR